MNSAEQKSAKPNSGWQRRTLGIIPSLAFMVMVCFVVGLSNNLVNSLNTSMSHYLEISDVGSTLLQIIYYGSYAIAAVPAFFISRRIGYQGGLITGLLMYVLGCLLSIPSTFVAEFKPHLGFAIFLCGLLVLSIGVAILDANYNPYVTKLGPEEGEVKRINFTNGFTGLGTMIGPFLLSALVISSDSGATMGGAQTAAEKTQYLDNIRMIYLGLAIFIGIFALILCLVKLPKLPRDTNNTISQPLGTVIKDLFKRPYFVFGTIAAFFALGLMFSASTMVGWAATEVEGAGVGIATMLVGVSALVSTIGRFASVPFLSKWNPRKVFGIYMIIAAALFGAAFVLSMLGFKLFAFIAFIATFYFMAITYVTTFSLTIAGCNDDHAKAGSCVLLFLFVGGGLFTLLFTYIGTLIGFLNTLIFYVPFLLYMVWFAFKGSTIGLKSSAN